MAKCLWEIELAGDFMQIYARSEDLLEAPTLIHTGVQYFKNILRISIILRMINF